MDNLNDFMAVRLMEGQREDIITIVRYAQEPNGEPKFESVSHFLRCAIMRMISEEIANIKKTRGRPRKFSKDANKLYSENPQEPAEPIMSY